MTVPYIVHIGDTHTLTITALESTLTKLPTVIPPIGDSTLGEDWSKTTIDARQKYGYIMTDSSGAQILAGDWHGPVGDPLDLPRAALTITKWLIDAAQRAHELQLDSDTPLPIELEGLKPAEIAWLAEHWETLTLLASEMDTGAKEQGGST